jgi:nascent polypeptide-associated complex subunit alpha
MVKVPKDLQKKRKNIPKRVQPKVAKKGDQSIGSRSMRRKMQQQGISMDPIDVSRVIFELEEKTLVIEQPEVFLIKQMGQEVYQVIGNAEEKSLDISSEESIQVENSTEIEDVHEEELKVEITEQDIQLVASQANVSLKEAESALKEANGNIAQAIIFLKNIP